MKNIALLGATGSIGTNALDVLRETKESFNPVLFSAHSNYKKLQEIKKQFPNALTALTDDKFINTPGEEKPGGIDFLGKEGLLSAIKTCKADICLNGISGAEGLEPSLAALEAGSHLALANKESIVMAGELIFSLAREKNLTVIPVDSEHMALLKLVTAHGRENISELILTASGGPFRDLSIDELKSVKPSDALNHPTWNMGPKITIDSASLANKGLEIIEAAGYFNFPPEKIKVVIHPQSIIHSMVRLKDGAVYAQMSMPDMRLTIHEALCWPNTEYSSFGSLDFNSLTLNFEKPDFEKFPMLNLAYTALNGNALLPLVYNAANEEAVKAFMDEKIGFPEIPRIVNYVLKNEVFSSGMGYNVTGIKEVKKLLLMDIKARELAEEYIDTGVHHDVN